MQTFHIEAIATQQESALKHKIDFKTKPIGALGQLEAIATQIGLIQNTVSPQLKQPHIVVFAADHGIANEGVSAYPQEVTFQMVMNFLNGGAAINVFCTQHNIALTIVDAGIKYRFPAGLNVVDQKIGMGTKNFLHEPAMEIEQAIDCIAKGATLVNKIYKTGCNVIGFGEMGIGNTSSASVLMSMICEIPITQCVGKGTGLNDVGVFDKIEILKKAIHVHQKPTTTLATLATFGGFEIAQMCGAMLQAAANRMLIIVDGFISSAAFLIAHKINPLILNYAIFAHQSNEQAHHKMLEYLKVKPVLQLDMRLGEGSGTAIAYPIIQSAVNFINEMASFEHAGVSTSEVTN